jgi:hypothetical protein
VNPQPAFAELRPAKLLDYGSASDRARA